MSWDSYLNITWAGYTPDCSFAFESFFSTILLQAFELESESEWVWVPKQPPLID